MKLKQILPKTFIVLLIFTISLNIRHIFSISPLFAGLFEEFTSISLYITDLLVIISLIPLFLLSFFKADFSVKGVNFKLYWPFCLISLIIFSSYLFSPRETYNNFKLLNFLEIIAFAIVISIIARSEHIKIIIFKAIAYTGAFQSLIALAQFLKQKSVGLKIFGESILANNIDGIAKLDIAGSKIIRAYGTFAHPNQLAAFLVVACATASYLFLTAKTKNQRTIYSLLLIFSTIGEFLTFSRAGIVSLYIVYSIFAATLLLKSKKLNPEIYSLAKKYLSIIFVTTIIIFASLSSYLLARAEMQAPSIYTRTLYNKTGIEIFKDNFIVGAGIGETFNKMAEKIYFTKAWQVQVPHNYFILIADEMGALGLAIFISFFGFLLVKLFKKIGEAAENINFDALTLFAIMVGIIFLMQFDHYFYTLHQTELLLWLMIGIIIAEISNKKLTPK